LSKATNLVDADIADEDIIDEFLPIKKKRHDRCIFENCQEDGEEVEISDVDIVSAIFPGKKTIVFRVCRRHREQVLDILKTSAYVLGGYR